MAKRRRFTPQFKAEGRITQLLVRLGYTVGSTQVARSVREQILS